MAISNIIVKEFLELLKGADSVIEMGNQVFHDNSSVKKYVEKEKKKHVSIDITGGDRSLVIDLSKDEIPELGKYDLVTNFGTSEHIDGSQFNAFKHMHDLCIKGGKMVHEVPLVGNWPNHCKYYYNHSFFKYLALKNDYETERLEKINYPVNGNLIFVVFKKTTDSKFLCEKQEFNEMIISCRDPVKVDEYWKKFLTN